MEKCFLALCSNYTYLKMFPLLGSQVPDIKLYNKLLSILTTVNMNSVIENDSIQEESWIHNKLKHSPLLHGGEIILLQDNSENGMYIVHVHILVFINKMQVRSLSRTSYKELRGNRTRLQPQLMTITPADTRAQTAVYINTTV